jgi:hypothetical protein
VEYQGRQAYVERRASRPGESGNYVYRLVSVASLARVFANLDRSAWAIDEPNLGLKTYMGYDGDFCLRLCIRFPFDDALVAEMRARGGTFERKYRVWAFEDEEVFDEVFSFVRSYFNLDVEERELTVVLSPKALFPDLLVYGSVNLLGRKLMMRKPDWSQVRCGVGVHILGRDLLEEGTRLLVTGVRSSIYTRELPELGERVLGASTLEVDPEGVRLELGLSERLVLKGLSEQVSADGRELRAPGAKESLEVWMREPFVSEVAPSTAFFDEDSFFDFSW